MALFDAFTGAPAIQAGVDTRNTLADLRSQVAGVTGTAQTGGVGALQAGQAGALGVLGPGYDQARTDVQGTTGQATGALYGGQDLGAGAITGSAGPALSSLYSGVGGAMAAYNPLLTAGQQYGSFGTQSAQMIADANGTNGPEGIARAQAAFRASPGYQYQVGQATDAATRAANTAGGALGGNTLSAVTGLAGNLADQDYSNWIKQLQTQAALYSPLQAQAFGAYGTGAGNAALTGGTGAANIYTGAGKSLADLYSTTGQAGSNLYQNTGKTLADIATGGAGAKASVYQTGGQNIAALLAQLSGQQVGFDQSTVAPTARSYEDAAAAQIGGSQNLWNLGVNAAKLGAGLPSGTFGGTYSNVNATPGTGYDASKFGYGGLYTG